MCDDPRSDLGQDGVAAASPAWAGRPPGWLAWLPVPAFLLAIAVLWAADSRAVYESPYLLMGLNLVFSTGVSLFVAYLAGRGFVARGWPGLLLLGCGVLFWGASGVVPITASLAKASGQGFNVNLSSTIHNTCVWASALCHFAGAAFSLRWGLSLRAREAWLVGGYGAVFVVVGLVVLAALSGWTPDFFVQGQGGTLVRQLVLGSAVAMFAFTAWLLRVIGRPPRSAFTQWYTLALLLLSVGYLAVLVQPVQGGLLGWTGRSAQFLGGAYILAAAVAALREAGAREIVVGSAWQAAGWHRYVVAVALTAAAAIVRLVFLQALGTQVAFVTFYPAVMIAALYGGLRPGLLAAVLSAALADYFWIEPVGQFAIGHISGWLGIAVFLFSCAMISVITESMHRAHARARAMEARAVFAGEPAQAERSLRAREARLAQERLKAVFPVNAVFPLAMAMLAALFWLSYRNAGSMLESEQGENHAYRVILEFDRLLSAVTATEAGERGFLITGDAGDLEPYRRSLKQVAVVLAELDGLTRDNPRQQQRLGELKTPIADKLGELERTVALRREQGFEPAQRAVVANLGNGRLDDVRRRVAEIQEEERRLRQQRMEAKVASTRDAVQTGTLGVGLGFAMLGLVYGLLRREVAERARAEAEVLAQRQELLAHRDHLEGLVEARTAELAREFAQHRQAEAARLASEARLRLVLEASSTGTFEFDFDSGEAQWNNVEFELLGLKPGDIVPHPANFFHFVHPADIGSVQAHWEDAVRTGHLDVEFRIVRADGQERWLAGRGRFALADGERQPGRRFLGVNFDITDHKRAEERLRHSEASLAQAQSIANIGSWEWDVPSGELRWSDQLFRIFGEEPQAFAPSFGAFMARVHSEDLSRLDGVFNNAIAHGVPFCLEHRIVTRQGVARTVLAQVEIELDESGHVARIVGTALDITERKQAEEARARLAAIVEFSQDAIIGKNLDGVVTSWNRGAEKLFGYSAAEMLGRPFACVIPSERMDEEMDILARIRRGEAIEHFETERLRKDGELIPIAVTVSPVRNQEGQVTGVSKIARDISERKRVEEERNTYIALVKTSADFIGMCDGQGIPFFVNEAGLRLVGLDSLDEALRTTVSEFFFPEDQAFIAGEFLPKVARDGHGDVEIRFRHFKTGEPIWMIYTVFTLQDLSGKTIGFATVSRNITARKQAEDALARQAEQLREADRHKDEFLAMLAHELRNPLTPIMIAAQMLEKRGGEDPALVRWASDTVKHQCAHLTQLVNQLLDVSRVSRGKITLDTAPVDLGTVVRQAVATAQPLIDEHGHELVLSLSQEPLWVEGDAVRLEQVLGNLLNNAAKYTPDGGWIWVGLSREAGGAVVRVRDNGAGMPAAMLPTVFELFTQAERTLDRAQGGLGIGLALVKSLVELHGGSVEAVSEGAGRGSEFTVRLPLSAQTPVADGASEPDSARPGGSAGRRVLAVEDNEFVLASLAMLLQSLGHEVHMARNGAEALDIAGKRPLDIALVDIGLPGMDGYEVARRLRRDFAPGRLTLVAMTGYNQEEDRQKSKNAGFDFHLAKPFDPAELEKILADLG